MIKELYNFFKEKYNKQSREVKTLDKVAESHGRIINSFRSFGVNNGPIPIILTDQDTLKLITCLDTQRFDIGLNSDLYLNGIYSESGDNIFLDKKMCKQGNPTRLDNVISHEYAHRIFRKFMSVVEERGEEDRSSKLIKGLLTGKIEEIDPLNKLKIYIESLKKIKLTERAKRRLEFDTYFEEMFAESVALYLTEQVDGDKKWFNYSKICQGSLLGQDKQFTEKLEKVLYNIFFDNLFTYGLKRITTELPTSYQLARYAFERRYLISIPESD